MCRAVYDQGDERVATRGGRWVHPYADRLIAIRDAKRAAWRAAGGDLTRFRVLMLGWLAAGKPRDHEWPDRDTSVTTVNAR